MFIDYAELMAEDEILMSMQDQVDLTSYYLINIGLKKQILIHKGEEYESF